MNLAEANRMLRRFEEVVRRAALAPKAPSLESVQTQQDLKFYRAQMRFVLRYLLKEATEQQPDESLDSQRRRLSGVSKPQLGVQKSQSQPAEEPNQ